MERCHHYTRDAIELDFNSINDREIILCGGLRSGRDYAGLNNFTTYNAMTSSLWSFATIIHS